MRKFQIFDWTGALKFHGQRFDSFEEAWGHIYLHAEPGATKEEREAEDFFSDWYVYEVADAK